MHRADLQRLVHRRLPDLLLRQVAQPHHVLVAQVQEVRRLGEAHGDRVGQEVQRELLRRPRAGAAVRCAPRSGPSSRRSAPRRPGPAGRARASRSRARRSDVRREARPATRGRHPVALVLRVGGVRELLAEGVGAVVHRPRELVDGRDVERLAEDRVPRRRDRERRSRRRPRAPTTERPAPRGPPAPSPPRRGAFQSTRRETRPSRRGVELPDERRAGLSAVAARAAPRRSANSGVSSSGIGSLEQTPRTRDRRRGALRPSGPTTSRCSYGASYCPHIRQ